MTTSASTYKEFLASIAPFDRLNLEVIERIASQGEPLRYRMGQTILFKDILPTSIVILLEGKARLLGYAPGAINPETLSVLNSGDVIGAASVVRGVACETVIASTPAVCLTLKTSDFQELLSSEPEVAAYFRNQCSFIEIYDLLGIEFQRRGLAVDNLKELATKAYKSATILNLAPGKIALQQLDPNLLWLVSSNSDNYTVGEAVGGLRHRINSTSTQEYNFLTNTKEIRLVGFTDPTIKEKENALPPSLPHSLTPSPLPFASDQPEELKNQKSTKYPYIHGNGPIDGTLACFSMLAQHLGIPYKRDVIKRALVSNHQRTGKISIELCGGIAELLGLKSQLVEIPSVAISKLSTPILVPWQDSFAIIYSSSSSELVLAIPGIGITRYKPGMFVETWGELGQVLLLQSTSSTPKKRFGLSWFLPAIKKHKTALIEVFIASLFVQLLGLANPLITQVIIDKVIVQNGVNTLNVLGFLLIAMAIVEGIIT